MDGEEGRSAETKGSKGGRGEGILVRIDRNRMRFRAIRSIEHAPSLSVAKVVVVVRKISGAAGDTELRCKPYRVVTR